MGTNHASRPTTAPGALQRARIDRGQNRGELAAAAGISTSALARLERGESAPSTATRSRLAAAGVDVSAIWPLTPAPGGPVDLAALRHARGLTIRDLEAVTGVGRSSIVRAEQGRRVTLPTASRLAAYYGLRVSDLRVRTS